MFNNQEQELSFDDIQDPNYVHNGYNAELNFDYLQQPPPPLRRLTNANIHVRGDAWCSMPNDIFELYMQKWCADKFLRESMGTNKELLAMERKQEKDAEYSQALLNDYPSLWKQTYCCIKCERKLSNEELVAQALGYIEHSGGNYNKMGWSTSETCFSCMQPKASTNSEYM